MLNVFVYLDSILVFSKSEEGNVSHIEAEKYEFHKQSVSFLGFVNSPGQIKIQEKVREVVDWLVPSDRKQFQGIRQFLLQILVVCHS